MTSQGLKKMQSSIGWPHTHYTAGKRIFGHIHTSYEIPDQEIDIHVHYYVKVETEHETTLARWPSSEIEEKKCY